METPKEIRERFLANAEEKYKTFSNTITVPKDHGVIGIRMPVVRKFAKEICEGDWRSYLNEIDDEYTEDMMLRGFIIMIADTDNKERFRLIREFVPKIDNWAVCDSVCMMMKVKRKDMASVWDFVLPFLETGEEFQIRFAFVTMLAHFMDAEYIDKIMQYADAMEHDAYYVRMGIAWCLAECFIKFPDVAMEYLKNNTLDKFTFNKTLSKITDSFRVSDDMKDIIRKMRRK
jgi:3-methyladenine DNA glycosylase AlkD